MDSIAIRWKIMNLTILIFKKKLNILLKHKYRSFDVGIEKLLKIFFTQVEKIQEFKTLYNRSNNYIKYGYISRNYQENYFKV